ncbi:Serine dehydratase alpha chain [Carboxydocella sporoproducens DSM 16521]|uniref:L-serine ammonia-lyase n=2 Tax=Carboxydocella TaxID=178898 RepID=A0A1T4RW74_9FIRM|nr:MULTISPECIES: L-serine ammonia-lyase, iron-sulfur-dependent, subunit alpha [Carboxydocella]AVX20266.1 Serine dehydratase alpha chain [Carboxydocella thermautotrophica]SKA20230.1 Serine dehydratase alpha chain [Carboxydocella sporoproducens DSM 16521]
MLSYLKVQELVEAAERTGQKLWQVILTDQAQALGRDQEELWQEMQHRLQVMRESLAKGLSGDNISVSGLSGRDAGKVQRALAAGRLLGGPVLDGAILKALAIAEVNAAMGRIVAAPTAGSCGILPGVLLTAAEVLQAWGRICHFLAKSGAAVAKNGQKTC